MKRLALITLLFAATLVKVHGQKIALKSGFQVLGSVEGRAYSGGLLEIEGKKNNHFSIYTRVGYSTQSENIVLGVPVQYQLFNIGTGLKYYFSEVFEGVHFKGGLFYASEYVDYNIEETRFFGPGQSPSFETQQYSGLDVGMGYSTMIDKIYLGFDFGLGYNFFNTDDGFIGFSTQVGYRF